jgi:hypothetical protein
MIGRGDTDNTFNDAVASLDKRIHRVIPSVTWNPFARDIRHTSIPPAASHSAIQSVRSVTLACNRSRHIAYLQHVMYKAQLMYDANAYLHWYKRYGVDKEQLGETFETVQSVIDNYRTMIAD